MGDMIYKLHKPIVLVGMMGAGKSCVGARLAKKMDVAIYDSDYLIAQDHGESVAQIFENHGEEYFRDLEKKKIAALLEGGPCVIATGGGAVTVPETLYSIKEKAISVWLKSDIDAIMQRVGHGRGRPLLRCDNPREKLENFLAERGNLYAQADIHIDNSSGNITDAVRAIEFAIAEKFEA